MEDESDLTGATPRRRPKPDVLEIGGRKLKPATLMMGHGFDPALSEGSLKPPIFLTSTFVFENAAAGKRHFEGVTGKRPGGAEGLIYSRFNGPNQEILEDRLSVWEDAEDALSFSSGMSAIATLLLAFVQRPGHVLSRVALLTEVWGAQPDVQTRTVTRAGRPGRPCAVRRTGPSRSMRHRSPSRASVRCAPRGSIARAYDGSRAHGAGWNRP